jgi:NADH-quinone oxidoreductase subunit L
MRILSGFGFFHLLTHALFRVLLLLCMDIIIHVIKNSQYINFIGGLSFQMPLTSFC